MTDRQKLQHLFQFDLWCTRKLTNLFIKEAPFSELSACAAFTSHIINAQEIWYNRVIGSSDNSVLTWTEYPLADIKKHARKAHKKWLDLIADHEVNLDSEIFYNNSSGIDFNNSLLQICQHLIIHGQHHRAQISIFLRKCDIKPPDIDYIHYTRKK